MFLQDYVQSIVVEGVVVAGVVVVMDSVVVVEEGVQQILLPQHLFACILPLHRLSLIHVNPLGH